MSLSASDIRQIEARPRRWHGLYTYERHHIPSGQTSTNSLVLNSDLAFYRILDTWNRQQPDNWQYWEAI